MGEQWASRIPLRGSDEVMVMGVFLELGGQATSFLSILLLTRSTRGSHTASNLAVTSSV